MPSTLAAAAVRHLLTGEGLPTLAEDRLPLDAIQRAWSSVAGTPEADAIATGLAATVGTSSALVDHQVARFFENHPGAPGGQVLYDAVRARPAAFPRDVPCPLPESSHDARQAWVRAALAWGPPPTDLLETIRAEVMAPGRAAPVIMALRARDGAWVDAHLNEILFASPDAAPRVFCELLYEGLEPEHALRWVLQRLPPDATIDPSAWRPFYKYAIPDAEGRARVDAALRAASLRGSP